MVTKTTAAFTTTLLLFTEGEARTRSVARRERKRRRSISAPAGSTRSSGQSYPSRSSATSKVNSRAGDLSTPTSATTTLFGCGTSYIQALSTLSPSTLCLGLEEHCEEDQVCYALPAHASSTDSSVPSSTHELLTRQEELEKEWMDQLIQQREHSIKSSEKKDEEQFVCGSTWDHAVSTVCDVDSSSLVEGASSGPIHCSSSCPKDMMCFASVVCDMHRQPLSSQASQAMSQETSEAISLPNQYSNKNTSLDTSENNQVEAGDSSWLGLNYGYASLLNYISFSS